MKHFYCLRCKSFAVLDPAEANCDRILGKMEMTALAALLVLGKQNVLPIWLLLKRIDKRAHP